ncbi:MAG: hypothetical protein AAFV98_02920 [Chloroflexota bacterium]
MSENQQRNSRDYVGLVIAGLITLLLLGGLVIIFNMRGHELDPITFFAGIAAIATFSFTIAYFLVSFIRDKKDALFKSGSSLKENIVEFVQELSVLQNFLLFGALFLLLVAMIFFSINYREDTDNITVYRQESLIALCNTSGRQLDMSDITIYVTDNTTYTIGDHFETAIETVADACWCFKPEIAQVSNQRCTADNTWNGDVLSMRNVSRWVNDEIQVDQNNTNIMQCRGDRHATNEYTCTEQE